MAFTDSIKKVANEAANSVGKFATNVSDSSKKIAEKAKLKHKISTEESIINGIYVSIGKHVFETEGTTDPEKIGDYIAEIKDHKKEIENLNGRIAAIDGIGICTGCGKQIAKDVKFCSACGTLNVSYGKETETVVEPGPNDVPIRDAEVSDADVYVDVEETEDAE